ncbi:hypothetical protein O181_008420 [Austropuccinia psidii MF-1]|uniref:Uncharacterized protein n=1 Tax=Austropuccinia psidii MF-1 TaxID=1389203 RepID=A0A9Q3BPW5_9BASI|nr:hypothetical protein [Austropuccinia psidii MF-1]
MVRGLRGLLEAPWTQLCWGSRGSMGPTFWPIDQAWSHQEPDLPKVEGDELDGEEAEVGHNSIGHQFSTSHSHPPPKSFQSHIIPRTPRTFQQTLATIPTTLPPASPSSSTARPALIPVVSPSPIPQSRNSPIVTSPKLLPVASSSRRREELSPLPFPAAQVFQKREHWPI